MVWLIPTTKEDVDKCLETLPSDYFGSGAFQAFYINIDFKVKNDEVKVGVLCALNFFYILWNRNEEILTLTLLTHFSP